MKTLQLGRRFYLEAFMSLRIALKLFAVSVVAFAAAFAVRHTFFWDVTPVSWDQEPQSLWALGAAFMLRTIENVAAVMAAIVLAFACTRGLDRLRASRRQGAG